MDVLEGGRDVIVATRPVKHAEHRKMNDRRAVAVMSTGAGQWGGLRPTFTGTTQGYKSLRQRMKSRAKGREGSDVKK